MRPKPTSEEAQGLSSDDLCHHRLPTSYDKPNVKRIAVAHTCVGVVGRLEILSAPSDGGRRAAAAILPPSITIRSESRAPAQGQPGVLSSACMSPTEVPSKEEDKMTNQPFPGPDEEQYHDSELGDVYDLYNACNGELDEDGLLDVRKLEELSPEEAKVLNVERLTEVWQHTAGRCVTCAEIVRILNAAREVSKD
jgi:hypothetical protein